MEQQSEATSGWKFFPYAYKTSNSLLAIFFNVLLCTDTFVQTHWSRRFTELCWQVQFRELVIRIIPLRKQVNDDSSGRERQGYEVGCMQGGKKKRKKGRKRRADLVNASLVIYHSSLLFTSVASKCVVFFPENVRTPFATLRHYSFEPSHSQKWANSAKVAKQ